MGQIIPIQYVTDAAGNKTAVQIPLKDWLAIEKEVARFLQKQSPEKVADKKPLTTLLAEGYLATKEEDREIMKDYEAADFDYEN
ncbi:MAG: hypothetical protein H6577_02625 [Lewinellaceae bacterium]|nr:hypothetical protein [Saprospiraceae bacterium]MCB9337004.1 hypothetical protein [Lewinellaceae bacterium]